MFLFIHICISLILHKKLYVVIIYNIDRYDVPTRGIFIDINYMIFKLQF